MAKKALVILISLVFAFFVIEFIIGNVLGFPKYGVKEKMTGLRTTIGTQNIYLPYSKYWNSKETLEIYKRNNLGLPGIDVDTGQYSRYISVLGSSFIENNSQKPEFMSTSVLQKLLKKIDVHYNVLNLGYNGCEPYDSYRRITYFENIYKVETVILVINDYISGAYKLKDNPFIIDKNEFKVDNSFKTKVNLLIRNNSAFLRLVLTLFQNSSSEQVVEPEEENIDDDTVDLKDLQVCLNEYNKKYGHKFICISIMNNEIINRRIMNFCDSNKINFDYSGLMIPENQLIGDWHLNEKGNAELGKFLFESFCKHNNLSK